MDLLLITVVAFCNFFLGGLVVKSQRYLSNLVFFGMTIFIIGWSYSNYYAEFTVGNTQLFLTRLTYIMSIGLASTFFTFSLIFPKQNRNNYKLVTLVNSFFAFLVMALFLTRLMVDRVEVSGGNITIYNGNFFPLFLIFFGADVLIALIVLIRKYFKAQGAEKTQIQYIFLGTFLVAIFASLANIVIPIVTSNWVSSRYGPLTTIFFVGFTSYAIIRHRLMDIRVVVARSVSYTILLTILASFYGSVIFLAQTFLFPDTTYSTPQIILQIILAVIMVFTFQPLRRWITKVTDKIFFKNAYDPEQLLDTLAHTIGATNVLIELCYKSLELILSQIKITRGLLVILTESGSVYTSQAKGYVEYPKIEPHDITRLIHDGLIVYDELEETSKYKHLLAKYNASIAIPLKTEGSTEGLLLLGEKESGDMYSQNDLKVFEIIAPELAVAITNAKAYEKIEKFNVTLREEVKKATAELERKNEQLRELDKAKDEFISMASHQLRTPLTAIKGYLSMLLEGDAGEIRVSQYDFVNEAFNGANRMVGLINDLLNVSRMETGRFFLEPAEVDMVKLVEEEMKQLQNNAKEKKLYLKFDLKKKKIPALWVDETKMRQVVMNFIDNALYYTTEGGVTVSLDADAHNVIFEVQDTGIGVPKAQQKNLFTKFYRADNARHVRPDGTGLGIYLAKRVMDDHGGEIIFHSTEGKGSTFGFKMPIKAKLKIKRVSAPAPTAGGETKPAIGELAAGIGISPDALEATSQEKPPSEIPNDKIDIAKAAGVEAPLPDSPDAKDMAKEADLIKKAASEVKEPVKK